MFKKKTLRINTYEGYGTDTNFHAKGRALEDENVNFDSNQNIYKTLKNIYKQLESDEIPNTLIELKLSNGKTFETTTDSEGYYHFNLAIPNLTTLTDDKGWVSYIINYKANDIRKQISNQNTFSGKMLIPSNDAQFAIISDIDDTILHTGVASTLKWRVAVNTLFKNYDKRMPVEGTVDFYKKLQIGTKKKPINPFFYVSNSPWNLYDYLGAFLEKNHFPKGPILLRDFRTPFDKTPKPKESHKRSEIINLLTLYPNLNFILIGDSGEKDADIYTKIAEEYPDRILAIYLRDVNHSKKEKRIKKIIQSFKTTPILLVHNSNEAIQHVKEHGFIN
ncbi:App1 family protein [Aquimarina muelleri]|uniref:Phosphatidate phosphatase APP1 catalytic domain-containing protein n=1 Tax=Aquimarina muelleri TaxID=279356 RepID=A0A918JSF7_9FLAO|nr:phosphatase domain-containing protein [Aquimarina muelleri]MCX2762659.1 DUF2183 domain-containing protein [Aquimarina muelleri]GGX05700.1 hypothetical protein GCM10007384_04250 [Aquimarina muelleri]